MSCYNFKVVQWCRTIIFGWKELGVGLDNFHTSKVISLLIENIAIRITLLIWYYLKNITKYKLNKDKIQIQFFFLLNRVSIKLKVGHNNNEGLEGVIVLFQFCSICYYKY